MDLTSLTDDPVLISLYDYWRSKRGARLMPSRRDIDPVEMKPSVLPHVVLAEYIDGGNRIRLRVAGTELENRFGARLTGVTPEDVMSGSYLAFINGLVQDVRREKAPVYSESVFRWDSESHRRTCRIYMPLGDGDEVQMLLIGQTFSDFSRSARDTFIKLTSGKHGRNEVRRVILKD